MPYFAFWEELGKIKGLGKWGLAKSLAEAAWSALGFQAPPSAASGSCARSRCSRFAFAVHALSLHCASGQLPLQRPAAGRRSADAGLTRPQEPAQGSLQSRLKDVPILAGPLWPVLPVGSGPREPPAAGDKMLLLVSCCVQLSW